MILIPETLDELFSDEFEEYLFGFDSIPPEYTYIPDTHEVVNCIGEVVDECKTTEDFRKKYPGGGIWSI